MKPNSSHKSTHMGSKNKLAGIMDDSWFSGTMTMAAPFPLITYRVRVWLASSSLGRDDSFVSPGSTHLASRPRAPVMYGGQRKTYNHGCAGVQD